MKTLTKIICVLIFGLSCNSCQVSNSEKDYYFNNPKISDRQGIPQDSFPIYFPDSILKDTSFVKTEIHTFLLNWFSSALYSAKEPILYNSYLGPEIYRFLWLRSFHKPVVFTLHNDDDKVWLTTKELDKHPIFILEYFPPIKFTPPVIEPDGDSVSKKIRKEEKIERKLIRREYRKVEILLDQTVDLTEHEWNEFEVLLNNCSFWSLKPYINSSGLDGSEWIIEGHLKSKYWVVIRWSPHNDFRKAGEYLIKKSGLKEKIY